MSDPILDDVKKLLDAEAGDKSVLEQIKRAAENNEVISNYERNYVAKLIDEHFKAPELEFESEQEPSMETIQEEITTTKEQMAKIVEDIPTPTLIESKPQILKNTKILIGGGAAVVAILVAVAIGLSGIQDLGPVDSPITGLTLSSDQLSYNRGDIISISGKSKTSLGNSISLSIENEEAELIWAEDVALKDSGIFSTLAIAGGPGWEKSGTYKLNAEHGSEKKEISFSFKN